MKGNIISVCVSPDPGLPKYPSSSVVVGRFGLEGDYHNREMRRSFSKPGTFKPNVDRHITLVAYEVIENLNQELDIMLACGSLAENITTKGLGDLSGVPDGARIVINDDIVLRVVEQNQPCKNLMPLHRLLVKKIYGRRGLLCAIEQGIGKRIASGDAIEVML
jgi:MOSC domain-containing protein YiiM